QTHDCDQSGQRKTYPFTLTAGLRITALIGRGIRHGYTGAVSQLHRPTLPKPAGLGPLTQHAATGTGQGGDHLQRQSRARPAIGSSAHAVHTQPLSHSLRRPVVDGSLARAILVQRLLHKHRQRQGRRIQPFAMLRQETLCHLQQLRTGEQIEEIDRTGSLNPLLNAISMLMGVETDITITQGYGLRGWRGGCVTTTSYQSRSFFLFSFQSLGSTNQSRWR